VGDGQQGEALAEAVDGKPDVPAACQGCADLCCLDANGKAKIALCPAPVADWDCVAGCCVPAFRCKEDVDCASGEEAEEACPDDRFECRCDVDTGQCFTWYCAVNAECGGDLCVAGACVAAPATDQLELRMVSPSTTLAAGATTTLLAEAYSKTNPAIVVAAAVTWTSSDSSRVEVDANGVAKGGGTTGVAKLTATLSDLPSVFANIEIENLDPGNATLTVICRVERTMTPVAGKYTLVAHATGEVLDSGPLEGGVIAWKDPVPAGGIDVHVFGDETDWVSWLGATGGVLYLPLPLRVWGKVSIDPSGAVVAAETTLIATNILRGKLDWTLYPTPGEFELSLTSFGFSSALFDFGLDAVLGANVKRFFHPDTELPGVDTTSPVEVPGGITFGFGGPALPDYCLVAPPDKHILWTLGGRVDANQIAPYLGEIVEAAGGGASLDFAKVASAIFPLFGGFWSGVHPGLNFPGDGKLDAIQLDSRLEAPMSLAVTVTLPPLPGFAELGYADAVFLLSGALTGDALFVPIGLNGGADEAADTPKDGRADGDPSTPEDVDPFVVPSAPLHGGLGGPHTRYAMVFAAAHLDTLGPRPYGGSVTLVRANPGARLGSEVAPGAFLGFPMGSTWDPNTRLIKVLPLADADTQRVLFKGKQGDHWTVWLNGAEGYTMPDPSAWHVGLADRTQKRELILANSFDFAAGHEVHSGAPGGVTLDRLIDVVERVSFLNVEVMGDL
jgi:hypothetical protein